MQAILVFPRAAPALVRLHAGAAPDALVLAVDGGADACIAAGVLPTLVVGDMDSVLPGTLAELARQGVRLERHPADKRDTDAALALAHAQGHDEVLFLGAGGGRADHALANLHLMAGAARWAQVRAVDEDVETWVVTPGHPLELRLPVGTILSAIPFDAEVEGITYEGLAYPLTAATMRAGDPYGVSNVARASVQRIRVTSGRLFVMRPLP